MTKNKKIIKLLIIEKLRENGIRANNHNTMIQNMPEYLGVTVMGKVGIYGKMLKINGIPNDYIDFHSLDLNDETKNKRVYL